MFQHQRFSGEAKLALKYWRKRTNVSRYELIVFLLAPFSPGRYDARNSVRHFEKSVGFIACQLRESISTNCISVIQKAWVHF